MKEAKCETLSSLQSSLLLQGLAFGLTACGGSGVPVGGIHSPADKALAADGYSFVSDMQASDLSSTNGMVTSGAIGQHDGDTEVVLETSTPGIASLVGSLAPGTKTVHVTVSGNAVKMYGPTADVMNYTSTLSS